MNSEKLIELFLYKIKAELTDIRMELNTPKFTTREIDSDIIGSLDKIHNWLDDVINEIEDVLN